MSNAQLETAIEAAWDARDTITPATTGETREAIEDTLNALDSGSCAWPSGARTALAREPVGQEGRAAGLPPQGHGTSRRRARRAATWWDKVDSKFAGWGENEWKAAGFRAVPNCVVRRRPISRRAWC
jgi:2,3,4,5-tetrahydropyridine-2-carboxylate N-succinyltransferase